MCVSVHVGGKKALAPITAVFGDPVVAGPKSNSDSSTLPTTREKVKRETIHLTV